MVGGGGGDPPLPLRQPPLPPPPELEEGVGPGQQAAEEAEYRARHQGGGARLGGSGDGVCL